MFMQKVRFRDFRGFPWYDRLSRYNIENQKVEVKNVFILNIGKEGTPYILSEKTSVIKKVLPILSPD